MVKEQLRVALIGCGGLGTSLAWGLLKAPDEDLELRLYDRHPSKTAGIAGEFPGKFLVVTATAHDAVEHANVVIIAVKPKDVYRVVAQIRDALLPDALLVSCAAGISIDSIATAVGRKAAIARAMPNTAVSVQAGTTAVCFGPQCMLERDEKRLHTIFGALGTVRTVDNEESLHALAALSGSGPAFMLMALETMIDAGVRAGLARSEADFFAKGAIRAAAALVEHGVLPPGELRAQITSPAGMTAEGIYALEHAGFRVALLDAIDAAIRCSKEMKALQPTP